MKLCDRETARAILGDGGFSGAARKLGCLRQLVQEAVRRNRATEMHGA